MIRQCHNLTDLHGAPGGEGGKGGGGWGGGVTVTWYRPWHPHAGRLVFHCADVLVAFSMKKTGAMSKQESNPNNWMHECTNAGCDKNI